MTNQHGRGWVTLALLLALAQACGGEDTETRGNSDAVGKTDTDAGGSDVLANDGQPTDTAAPDASAGDTTKDATQPQCTTAADCSKPPAWPCIVAKCTADGSCTTAVNLEAGAVCDDGNACTGPGLCDGGACQPGKPKACDGGNPCAKDTCDAKTGLCASSVDPATGCMCQGDSDCPPMQDKCLGAQFCDKSGDKWLCKPNPKTAVACPGGNACTDNTCDPKSGTCVKVQKPDNTGCSDGDPCTTGDVCSNGQCTAGTQTCCFSDTDCLNAFPPNLITPRRGVEGGSTAAHVAV
jgi:hypothetical protein